MNILVVTAVAAEREAVGVPGVTAIVAGAGPAAAAAATAAELATAHFDLVISAGIAGGFAPIQIGQIAVASTIVFADLGAETSDGFRSAEDAGFGVNRYEVEPSLAIDLADRTGGHLGTILTVATVTGTASTAQRHLSAHPDAVAEAMEGAGVAEAASRRGVAFAEIRAISNHVGPRNRADWRIEQALAALAATFAAFVQAGWTT